MTIRSRLAMHLLLIIFFQTALYGCSAVVLGIGAGAGAVAYSSGGISRIYEAEYHRAVDASVQTLNQLKIPPDEKTGDELKTEIRAFRADGSPVKLEVERINPRHTQISVRTGTIGILDKPVSHQIHENIERKLLRDPERAEIPPEHTLGRLKKTNPRQPTKEQTSSKASAPEPIPKSDRGPDKPTPQKQPLAMQGYENRAKAKCIIFFSQGSNMLQEKAMEKLGEIAAMMSEKPEAQLMITGFPDPKGSAAFKRMLSERRANTVKLYLVANGIDPSRSQVRVQSSEGDLPNQGAVVEIVY